MPAGALTVANTVQVWSDLTRLAPVVWRNGAMIATEEVQKVMDLVDVDALDQFNRDYSAISDSGFGTVTQEGADYTARFINQYDRLSLTVVKRTDMKIITEDLVEGNKYPEIGRMLTDLGGSLFRTRARDVTHVNFTFAGSTSYTDAQGNSITNAVAKGSTAVVADTHTLADGSNLDNNQSDTPIGESTLRSLENLTVDFPDENGNLTTWGLGGKVLVIPMDVAMEHAAIRLSSQEWNYNSASRDINVFSDNQAHGGAYSYVELRYLATLASGKTDTTKKKYYFALDRKYAKENMIFGDRLAPQMLSPLTDIYNRGMIYGSRTWYDIGTVAAHHIAGCLASA